MKDTTKKEFKIGLAAIAALLILYFGIEFLKGHSPFNKHSEYCAVYDNVLGLTPTANVSISGVKVGQVSSVELIPEEPGKVMVRFTLDQDINLPLGTSAVIEKDLLGTSSLIINLGTGDRYFEKGATIPSSISSGLMSEVSDMLPEVSNVFPKVDTLLTNLNNVIGHPALQGALINIETATKSLNGMIANIDKSTKSLPNIVDGANNLITSLNAVAGDVKTLSTSLANAPIDSTLVNVNNLSANLAALSDQLNNNNSTLGLMLNNSDLYDNLRQVSSDIDSLILDIKRNPKRYISIKLL